MGQNTGIEWTDATWNPVTGCTKVSQGCKHCYAERIWKRPYPNRAFTDVQCHPDRLTQPIRWKKPKRIFVNSMSDLFHERIPFWFIDQVFAAMALSPQHVFQILTKRPERMCAYLGRGNDLLDGVGFAEMELYEQVGRLPAGTFHGPTHLRMPLPNVWLGVSVENQETADERIPLLVKTPAAVRFLSCEPLLGPINLRSGVYSMSASHELGTSLYNIHWVIAGGESGPKARPSNPNWFRSIRDQCVAAGVPFHFKQWGEWAPARRGAETHLMKVDGTLVTRDQATQTRKIDDHRSISEDFIDRGHPGWARMRRVNKKLAGRTLDGETWDQYPE